MIVIDAAGEIGSDLFPLLLCSYVLSYNEVIINDFPIRQGSPPSLADSPSLLASRRHKN